MGKMKIGIYWYFTADILIKVFQKYFLSGPLPNIYFFFKPLNLIGCHGNQKAKFLKNIYIHNSKNQFPRSYIGVKLNLCRSPRTFSHYKIVVHLLPLRKCFDCYDNIKYPKNYNWENENWFSLLSHCKYFYIPF